MPAGALPFYGLFERLRSAGLPIGPSDYAALLRMLADGHGLPDEAALLRLIRMLWTKSPAEAELLRYHFDQYLPKIATAAPLAEPPVPPLVPPADDKKPLSDTAGGGAPRLAPAPSMPAHMETVPAFRIEDLPARRLIAPGEFYPVTARQMQQSWRHFRRPVRQGPAVELDLRATIAQIGREGMFRDVVLMPRRVNRAELVLLLDRNGSMVPFHGLLDRLTETAARGGRLGRLSVYYFHDCPIQRLYCDPALFEGEKLARVLEKLGGAHCAILIVSDAGAARARYQTSRVAATSAFLQTCRRRVPRVAWLNPVPCERWSGTSAGAIAKQVAMYPLDRPGLDAAIDYLRGRGGV